MSHGKSNYQMELDVALEAVGQAAELCRSVGKTVEKDALEKKDRSPVTVADFGSQAIICRFLKQNFPADPIVAEENSQALMQAENTAIRDRLTAEVKQIWPEASEPDILKWIDFGGSKEFSDRFWTLDPIDGTKGFLRGGQYAISLSLIVDGVLTISALGCPNLETSGEAMQERGVLFFARRGGGAFTTALGSAEPPREIQVSKRVDSRSIRMCESFEKAHSSHEDAARLAEFLGIAASPVRIDSQAKYGLIARGDGEAYLRLPRNTEYREKIWDHAGGALIVSEAGGRVTDIHGRSLEFHHGHTLSKNTGVIATNGRVHESILEAISKLKVG